MAINEVVQLSAINVVLTPHPAGIYERLIRSAYSRKIVANTYSDRFGIMSQLHKVTKDDQVIAYEGVISTFTKLDSNLPWFNSETSNDASEDDLGELNVPEHLQPNHRKCDFYFDLRSHVFIFESLTRKGGISPKQMIRYLSGVFLHPGIIEKFGVANLTIIPDKRSVNEIFEWGRVRSLYIHATRPNPDYDEDDLQEFEESLDDQNAKELDMKLVAQDNEYLSPSERVQTIAAIAADNGYVEARGENELGEPETRSTKDKKPLIEREFFDPDAETAWDAFRRIAQSVASNIRARRKAQKRTSE